MAKSTVATRMGPHRDGGNSKLGLYPSTHSTFPSWRSPARLWQSRYILGIYRACSGSGSGLRLLVIYRIWGGLIGISGLDLDLEKSRGMDRSLFKKHDTPTLKLVSASGFNALPAASILSTFSMTVLGRCGGQGVLGTSKEDRSKK